MTRTDRTPPRPTPPHLWRLLLRLTGLVGIYTLLLAGPVLAQGGERAVPLQGTRNTRQLGGLPAAGGLIRADRIYRSGALCFITPSDVATLKRLHIRTLIELRQDSEIARDGPDRPAFAQSVPRRLHLPLRNHLGNGRDAYTGYITGNAPLFAEFFRTLAREDSYPVLFHCSAGKDRAGILSALILLLAGTPEAVIMDDYLQSVRNSPKLIVHREWLEAALSEVREAGGIEAWLARIGVATEEQTRIRTLLIEPAPALPDRPGPR